MNPSLTLIDIDSDVSQYERDTAEALINKELKSTKRNVPHPSLHPFEEPSFSELASKEIERVAAGQKIKGGIDLSRYDVPEPPTANADVKAWRDALRQAYSASSYLSSRQTNLQLLEEYGKNAWLISNSQLDEMVKGQELELERLKQQTESVNKERKAAQEGSRGEITALDATWKEGIERLVKVQLATNQLRQEALKRNGR